MLDRTSLLLALLCLPCALWPRSAAADTYLVTGGINADYPSASGNVYIYTDSYNRNGFATTGGDIRLDDVGNLITGVSLHSEADSIGGPGFLLAHTYAEMNGTQITTDTPTAFAVGAVSSVRDIFTDVTVTGPTSGPVATRINLHIHGAFITGTSLPTDGSTAANNGVSVGASVNGTSLGSGNYAFNSTDGSTPAEAHTSGWFTGFTGDIVVATPNFLVTTGVPFTLQLEILTTADVTAPINRGHFVYANTDFSSTFSFATDRPVFVLPDGFTANSLQAGITDNTFSLPEPATISLLAIAALPWRRRPRHR